MHSLSYQEESPPEVVVPDLELNWRSESNETPLPERLGDKAGEGVRFRMKYVYSQLATYAADSSRLEQVHGQCTSADYASPQIDRAARA